MASYVDLFIQFYSKSPLSFGAADICSVDSPQSVSRAAAFSFVMFLARNEAEERAVKRVLVIMPPREAVSGISQGSIRASAVDTAQHEFCRALDQKELAWIDEHIIAIHAEDFSISSALRALDTVGEREAAIVLYAGYYRDDNTPPASMPPSLEEDRWVPHLVRFAHAVTEYAKKSNCYVLIDTGETPPHREHNRSSLMSIVGCGLVIMTPQKDGTELIAGHLSEWLQDVKKGNVGTVFASVDALPEWMDSQKAFIKLQLLANVAPGQEVSKMLRAQIEECEYIDPSARVRMARIAQRADDEGMASDLLKPAIAELTRQEELELALEIAGEVSDADLTDEAAKRLALLFPKSTKPFKHRLTHLMDQRRYSEVVSLLNGDHPPLDPELESFYNTLATAFQGNRPDYRDAIQTISRIAPALESWGRALSAREALARRDFATSISLCLPAEERPLTPGTARMLLYAVRQVLLQRNSVGDLVLTGEELAAPVAALVQYLANNPTDGRVRVRLVDLLSIETSGSLGLAVAVSVVLSSAGASPAPARSSNFERKREIPDLDLMPFLRSVQEWMACESPLILHIAKLPASLLTAPADDIFANLRQLVAFDQDLRDNATAKAFEQVVYTSVLLAPLTSKPNEDLDLLRYSAARFIAANRLQRGRDLAEEALVFAGDVAERRRLAWLAYADIYHRAHNFIDSLIGLACMFAVDVDIDFEQMWQEIYLLVRILRDLHFFIAAKSALDRLEAYTQKTESPTRYARRLATLRLGVRLSELTRRDNNRGQLVEITNEIERHCLELFAVHEDVTPGLSLLVHCIHLGKFHGLPVPDSAVSTLQKLLPNASASLADLIATISRPETDGSHLLALAKSVETARNYDDIAFDLTHVALVARRFLDTEVGKENAEAVMLAIEALADQAIQGSSIGGAESAFSSLGITRERAASISTPGYEIVCLGLSEAGRLVRVNIVDGNVQEVVVETEAVFSARALEKWSQDFPYSYSYTDDPNAFWTSTDGLGLTMRPTRPAIMVMDTSLQRLPPNLIRLGQQFAGRVIPVAGAPSISWLTEMRAVHSAAKTGRKAWIPMETTNEEDTALLWLAERLSGTLDSHNFALDTGTVLPDDFRGCELIIIAAHGGLLPEKRFIQKLSASKELAIYPETLAAALAGSSIVILFICSGGRIDSHPHAETTVGLVKQLLNERCSTVVAPPWPLDVKVPPRWLPTFLEKWSEGSAVIEAAFHANAEVARWFGDDPKDCLAMNVFGDPLRKKSDNGPSKT